jgi:hypothetical protein
MVNSCMAPTHLQVPSSSDIKIRSARERPRHPDPLRMAGALVTVKLRKLQSGLLQTNVSVG